MKRTLFSILIIMGMAVLWGQQAVPPLSGEGNSASPYQISNLGNLYWIASEPSRWGYHYIQTADVNGFETFTWDGGWEAIGTEAAPFTGTYDGGAYSINFLMLNRPIGNQGLFGAIGATGLVKNLSMSSVMVNAFAFVGALAGSNYGQIVNCHVNAEVSLSFGDSGDHYGGLVGYNLGQISQSSSLGSVSNPSGNRVGGLVGENLGSITNSYSRASVFGAQFIGGLVGAHYGSLHNSYSTGEVISSSGSPVMGGLVGYGDGTGTNSFWDMENSGQTYSLLGIGLFTSEMQDLNTYLAAGWDFDSIWDISPGVNGGYPFHSLPASEVSAPLAIAIDQSEDTVTLNWAEVPGASSYRVYSASSPDGVFSLEIGGFFQGASWSSALSAERRFYRVTAVD